MFTGLINLTAQPAVRYAAALFVFSLTVNLAQFNWAEAPIDLLLNTLVLLPLLLFAVHVSERIKLRPVNSVARADSVR
jgi:hypothetical protein